VLLVAHPFRLAESRVLDGPVINHYRASNLGSIMIYSATVTTYLDNLKLTPEPHWGFRRSKLGVSRGNEVYG
jgi:hypothetical protein